MSDLKQRLLSLVSELAVPSEIKFDLVARIEKEGVSQNILSEVRLIIESSIKEHKDITEAEVERLQAKLQSSIGTFKKKYFAIEANMKEADKKLRKERDEQDLEQVRKGIKGV